MPTQQRAQHHEPTFAAQQLWRCEMEFFKYELRQAIKRKYSQSREAGNISIRQQLALELEGSLFGREQDQRRAVRRLCECGADFSETSERLAAAGGAEEKARLHAGSFPQRRKGATRLFLKKDF
jgi:hypothetical protein